MTPSERLTSIDMLRGVAAIAVTLRHILHFADLPESWTFRGPAYLMSLGSLGVPLFIVISGFCIHRRAAVTGHVSWTTFWKRRFCRLYPTYVAALAFSAAVACWIAPELTSTQDRFLEDAALHLAMVHNLTERFIFGMGNGAFWSLGIEEQLYALYAVLLALRIRWNWRVTMTVVVTVAILWGAWSIARGTMIGGMFYMTRWWFWPFGWWLPWALGALSVESTTGRITLSPWTRSWKTALALGVAALMLNRETGRELANRFPALHGPVARSAYLLSEALAAVAFFVVINWLVAREASGTTPGSASRSLAWVGRFSYSLYLTHIPVIAVMNRFVISQPGRWNWALLTTQHLAATILFGWLFYWLIERHFIPKPQPLPT